MSDQLLDFSGLVAVVTGGSRGLGKEMALAMAERGAEVVITSRKAEACEEVARQIDAMGKRSMAYGCHIGHWDEIQGLIDATYDRFGRIDILINNAGMSPLYDKLSDVPEALFDKVIDYAKGQHEAGFNRVKADPPRLTLASAVWREVGEPLILGLLRLLP